MTSAEIKSLIQQLPAHIHKDPRALYNILHALADSGGTSFAFTDTDGYDFNYTSGLVFDDQLGIDIEGHVQSIVHAGVPTSYYKNSLYNNDNTVGGGTGGFYPMRLEEFHDASGRVLDIQYDATAIYKYVEDGTNNANFNFSTFAITLGIESALDSNTLNMTDTVFSAALIDSMGLFYTDFEVRKDRFKGYASNSFSGEAVSADFLTNQIYFSSADNVTGTVSTQEMTPIKWEQTTTDYISANYSKQLFNSTGASMTVVDGALLTTATVDLTTIRIYNSITDFTNWEVNTTHELAGITSIFRNSNTTDINTFNISTFGILLSVDNQSAGGITCEMGIKQTGGNGKPTAFVTNLENYVDLAAAQADGLVSGDFFRIGHQVCVVP